MSELEKLAMAHRYLYYVKCAPIISDSEYDALERSALAEATEDSPLHRPGSDSESSYSDKIKKLAGTLLP